MPIEEITKQMQELFTKSSVDFSKKLAQIQEELLISFMAKYNISPDECFICHQENKIWVERRNLKMSKVKIVIADRGWVFVGREYKSIDGILLKNAFIIRKWGTTEGLGELAIKGRLENTILDQCLDVEIPSRSIIAVFECDDSKWEFIL